MFEKESVKSSFKAINSGKVRLILLYIMIWYIHIYICHYIGVLLSHQVF